MKTYGLLGRTLKHSFSRQYFTEKFRAENIDAAYLLFELDSIEALNPILLQHTTLEGLNVTFPYKKEVIPLLDWLSPDAAAIGAINTIKIIRDSGLIRLEGYNTDAPAFKSEMVEKVDQPSGNALILGTGGAAAAAEVALKQLSWEVKKVSRSQRDASTIGYTDLTKDLLQKATLIINVTPLGTFPDIDTCPSLPWQWINASHFLFDMVYNPSETLFMQHARECGAHTTNGLGMLYKQAELSWEIWNSPENLSPYRSV